LLSGRPPFSGDNDKEILDAVKLGVFSLASKEWSAISPEAKDLIKQMLTFEPN
jgi:calcium-dependent protein kinase